MIGPAFFMPSRKQALAAISKASADEVDVVVLAVDQGVFEVHRGEAGQHAGVGLHPDALLDRRDVFPRHRAADHLVLEQHAAVALQRLEDDLHLGVLAGAAGLLLVGVGLGVRPGDGLAIRHLRRADIGLHAVFAAQPVDDDLQVQLAHAGQDGLAGLLVGAQPQADGSSPASFCRPMVIFSTASLVRGSTEMSITGTGKAMRSSTTGSCGEASVSPVPVSFRPTKAAMSPADTSLISARLSACIWNIRPMRSRWSLVVFSTVSPDFSVPE